MKVQKTRARPFFMFASMMKIRCPMTMQVRASFCAATGRGGEWECEGEEDESHFDGGASMEISNDVDAVAAGKQAKYSGNKVIHNEKI